MKRWLAPLALGLVLSPHADAVMISREFTGAWYDPSKSGQGFTVEVVDRAGAKVVVAYWYTFDNAGRAMWLFGDQELPSAGSANVTMTLRSVQGPRFVQNASTSQLQLSTWGQLSLEFQSCNSARASYSGVDGTGTLNLVRLTNLFAPSCTGTLIDDEPRLASPDSVSSSGLASVTRAMSPLLAGAKGELKYRVSASDAKLSVEAENIPVGSYQLLVDGTVRANMTVAASASGPRGEVEFESPPEAGKLPLDFNPVGRRFVLRGNGQDVLSGELTATGSATGGGSSGGGTQGTAPPFGNAEYRLKLGDSPAAEASFKLEQRSDRVKFSAELSGVAAGRYELAVAGVVRGSVDILSSGAEVEIEFQSPVEPGKLLLNFDPRGVPVAWLRNGTAVLSGTFPTQPTP